MDITPKVNLLKSLRGRRFDPVRLAGEAVDNAFDASARSIKIKIAADEISFIDDGVGITLDRIASLFSLGDHGAMTTTQLGRFGVGIKSQAVNAGDALLVDTISRDGRYLARVNWRALLESNQWIIDNPRRLPLRVGSPTGTRIAINELRKRTGAGIDRVRDELAVRFHPALIEGRVIELNGDPITPLAEPDLLDVIECQISLSKGRGAHLRGGILAEASKLNRVHVGYRHRVIMPHSPLGWGDYGGTNRMFARLQLSGPWHLAEFKDDLPDEEERSELEEAVHRALLPVLEKVSVASFDARIDEISQRINDLLPPEIAAARPRKTGAQKMPTGRRQQRDAGRVSPDRSDPGGPAKAMQQKFGRLLISFDGDPEEDGIGTCRHVGKQYRVDLAKDSPLVARLIEHRDQEVAAQSLLAIALMIYEQGRQQVQPDIPELFGPFGKRIANLLATQPKNGKEIVG
jgi:hypothetical protein